MFSNYKAFFTFYKTCIHVREILKLDSVSGDYVFRDFVFIGDK